MASPTTPPPRPASDPATRRGATDRHHRAGLIGLVVIVVALVATIVGCSSDSGPSENASPADQQVGAAPSSIASTTTTIPDALPDPGVAPGECKIVTYTPPTASVPMGGELCRPKENQRDVAVMVIHGGSGISGSFEGMRRWANRYIAEGYVTFLPSYHLFGVGGESPVFPHPEQNIKAAVQFLRGTGNALEINKDRIVVQGQSAGARVGAVAYTTPGDFLFQGNELYADVPDTVNGFIGFYHPYDGTMQYADQYFGGSELSTDVKVQTRLDKGDSLGHANDAKGPALFITGGDDWEIIDQQQEAFAAALKLNGYEAESVVIPGGGHGFDEGGQTLSQLGEQSAEITLQWLNTNFPQSPGARGPGGADRQEQPARPPPARRPPPTSPAPRRRAATSAAPARAAAAPPPPPTTSRRPRRSPPPRLRPPAWPRPRRWPRRPTEAPPTTLDAATHRSPAHDVATAAHHPATRGGTRTLSAAAPDRSTERRRYGAAHGSRDRSEARRRRRRVVRTRLRHRRGVDRRRGHRRHLRP